MPITWTELQRQLDAEGVTDVHDRNRRTAQMVQSGELVRDPEPEVTPAMKGEGYGYTLPGAVARRATEPAEPPQPGLVEAAQGAAQQYGEGIAEIATDPTKAMPGGTIAQFRAPIEKADPSDYAQVPQQMAQAGMQGLGMPQFPMMGAPSTKGISEAMGKQQAEYEKATKGLEKSTGKYQEAIQKRAGVEAEAIQTQAELMETRDRVQEDMEAQRVQREQERQAYMQEEVSKVRNAVMEINESGIDPYRFYRHADGSVDYPKSVASAIAIGLGALASNLPAQYGGTGGPNVALQIIDKAIDRDIQAQRDDLANRRAGVGLQMNLLGQMRARFADERQAEQAARMVMLETYKNKIQTAAADSADDKIRANADVLTAEVDQKLTEAVSNIATTAAAAFTTQQTQLFGAEMGRRKMIQGQREKKFGTEMAQRQAAMKPAGKQLPASAVQKMSDFRGAANIIGQVEKAWVDTMEGSFGAGISQYAPWATEAKSFSDMTAMAAQFIGKKLEGRMTDEDYDRMKAMLPTPGDSNERAMKKLDALRGFLRAMDEETIRTYEQTGYDVTGFQQSMGAGQAPEGFSAD